MAVWTILDHFGPVHFPTVLRPLPIPCFTDIFQRNQGCTVRSPSRSAFEQAPRKLVLVDFGREEYSYQASWRRFRGGPAALHEPYFKQYSWFYRHSRAAKRGCFKRGGFSRSGLVLPFLSFLGLSRFFWDFPELLGDGLGIFPICPFTAY